MSILIIVEIFSVLTVLGLFTWVFKKQKNAMKMYLFMRGT